MNSRDNTKEQKPRGEPSPVRLGLYATLAVFSAGAGFLTARHLIEAEGPAYSTVADREASVAATGTGKLIRRAEPETIPDLVFSGADGSSHRLSDWRGKVVLLNLWATWCAPCKEEMPSLDRLQAKLGGDRFAVLALSVDRTGLEKPVSFFAGNGIQHLAVYNDAKADATAALRASGLPLSVILDAQGHEVARLIGSAAWDSPDMAAKVAEFINGGKPG